MIVIYGPSSFLFILIKEGVENPLWKESGGLEQLFG